MGEAADHIDDAVNIAGINHPEIDRCFDGIPH